MQVTKLFTILLVSFFFSTSVSAQVFDSGPSDSAQFTNVIDLPGGVLPDVRNETITVGGVEGETTQVNVANGSTVPDSLDILVGAEVNISGGSVAEFSAAASGSEVNISDGSLGALFIAAADVEVNISGGTVGNSFRAFGSTINLSGGSVGNAFSARENSVINISGGSVGSGFNANAGSQVNLFGSDFMLNGTSIEGLVLNESFTIADRDVTLTGTLEDGSPFSFDLNSNPVSSEDSFAATAMLTVTATTESGFLLGDVNRDNVVDFDDISSFISILSMDMFQEEADINRDGDVDFSDIGPFITLLAE